MATVEIRTVDGDRLVRIVGEVDMAGADDVGRILTTTVHELETPDSTTATPTLEIDLAEVPFIDSSGIRALVRAKTCATDSGVRLTITNARGIVERALVTLGLYDYLTRADPS
jgi:anti-sigma B factor antagonist